MAEQRQKRAAIRRSLHFVPGGQEKMFNKALSLPADALILDLEDSVTADNKLNAREAVCEWLEADFGHRQRLVRINPLDSEFGRGDLQAVMAHCPDGIVLPKVAGAQSVTAAAELLRSLEQEQGMDEQAVGLVLIGTEDAAAVFQLQTMISSARVDGLTWGAEDLSVSLGAKAKRDEQGNYLEVFSVVRSLCLLAAAAAGVQAIDSVFVDIHDQEGLRREAQRAAAMGFTGKLTIHPDQIEIVNAAFSPSPAEIDEAHALIKAFEEQQQKGRMAFRFNGQMVDVPHLKRAREILAVAAHISAQTS